MTRFRDVDGGEDVYIFLPPCKPNSKTALFTAIDYAEEMCGSMHPDEMVDARAWFKSIRTALKKAKVTW
jgi:hypothetical protein